jgi:hypothetical protein
MGPLAANVAIGLSLTPPQRKIGDQKASTS